MAQQIVQAFFPELKGHDYPMLIARGQSFDRPILSEQFLRDFDIAVEESPAAIKPATEETIRDHVLVGNLMFSRDGDLDSMFVKGKANYYSEHLAFLQEMEAHPEWSTADVRHAFKGRGVRLWSENEQEFLKGLHPAVDTFAAALGGDARNLSSVFELAIERPGPPIPPAPPVASFDWRVSLDVVPWFRGRPTTRYVLIFEPTAGKLLHVIKIDP